MSKFSKTSNRFTVTFIDLYESNQAQVLNRLKQQKSKSKSNNFDLLIWLLKIANP